MKRVTSNWYVIEIDTYDDSNHMTNILGKFALLHKPIVSSRSCEEQRKAVNKYIIDTINRIFIPSDSINFISLSKEEVKSAVKEILRWHHTLTWYSSKDVALMFVNWSWSEHWMYNIWYLKNQSRYIHKDPDKCSYLTDRKVANHSWKYCTFVQMRNDYADEIFNKYSSRTLDSFYWSSFRWFTYNWTRLDIHINNPWSKYQDINNNTFLEKIKHLPSKSKKNDPIILYAPINCGRRRELCKAYWWELYSEEREDRLIKSTLQYFAYHTQEKKLSAVTYIDHSISKEMPSHYILNEYRKAHQWDEPKVSTANTYCQLVDSKTCNTIANIYWEWFSPSTKRKTPLQKILTDTVSPRHVVFTSLWRIRILKDIPPNSIEVTHHKMLQDIISHPDHKDKEQDLFLYEPLNKSSKEIPPYLFTPSIHSPIMNTTTTTINDTINAAYFDKLKIESYLPIINDATDLGMQLIRLQDFAQTFAYKLNQCVQEVNRAYKDKDKAAFETAIARLKAVMDYASDEDPHASVAAASELFKKEVTKFDAKEYLTK